MGSEIGHWLFWEKNNTGAGEGARSGGAGAGGTLVERNPRLTLDGLGDRPLVVLAEKHDRRVVGGREDERLVHVALTGGAVAEVGDHGRVAIGVAGADGAVALDAHGGAGGGGRAGGAGGG